VAARNTCTLSSICCEMYRGPTQCLLGARMRLRGVVCLDSLYHRQESAVGPTHGATPKAPCVWPSP
jgi:hypothetical protein